MSNEQLLDILTKFNDYLHISGMVRDIARSFLDWIVSVLLWVVDHISGILYETTKFLGFYNAESMGDKGLFGTLGNFQKFGLGISILLIGAVLFFGKTTETREVPLNFLMMLIITLMLPGMMSDGIKIVNSTTDSLKVEQGELGFKTFKDNLTDVYVLADNGWTTTTPNPPNYLKDRDNFDINEKVLEAPDGDNGDPLKNKLIDKKGGEGKEVVELEDGGGGIFGWITKKLFAETYYRWRVDWVATIGTLLALSFAMIISILRACRVSIEMAFDYIWANVIAFFSIRDIKKLKMALMSLLGGFILLLSIFTMYYVFINWNTYIFQQPDVSYLTKIFGLLAGAWFIYDGPAIIQKTLGIDAGLSTAGAFLMTAGGAKAIKGSTDLAKGTVEGVANSTVRTAGLLSGLFSDGKKNSEDNGVNSEMEEEKNHKEENEQDPETNHENDEKPENESNETTETEENEMDTHDSVNKEESEDNGDSLENIPDENVSEDESSGSIQDKETDEDTLNEEEPKNTTNDFSESPDTEETIDEQKNKNESDKNNGFTSSTNQEDDVENDKNNSKNNQNKTESSDPNRNRANDSSHSNQSDFSNSTKKNEFSFSDSQDTNTTSPETPNPFKKRMNQVIHRSKYENQGKSYIGQQVDRYNRNKEFGQDVRDWLKERKKQENDNHNE
ncbi:pLS20_p028 family conjugation system transmembrane protein [Enterococcus faecium]|uniref:pLS20_p028 family conjugation system transmembrane protein n=1 Tax=Enterococcus faecium TaxID=1352 RepID=UPI000CF2A8C6|nr:hypothetical protein [Enterococcus faecium]EGP4986320.1 hypothetical protein [Enterococcus faecium]EGP5140750.1 hypothetical protein [Enterococcus faecium]EME7172603.1 hypothetical protein [Enterococcus faecium]PQE60325.1 hypothetical protein CUS10_12725 [Enterococcus faecium]